MITGSRFPTPPMKWYIGPTGNAGGGRESSQISHISAGIPWQLMSIVLAAGNLLYQKRLWVTTCSVRTPHCGSVRRAPDAVSGSASPVLPPLAAVAQKQPIPRDDALADIGWRFAAVMSILGALARILSVGSASSPTVRHGQAADVGLGYGLGLPSHNKPQRGNAGNGAIGDACGVPQLPVPYCVPDHHDVQKPAGNLRGDSRKRSSTRDADGRTVFSQTSW